MRPYTVSAHYARLGVLVAIVIVALVTGGGSTRADLLLGQWGGFGVADACEPAVVPPVDFNLDEAVDFRDFAQLAPHWQGGDLVTDVAPAPGDGIVNFKDLSALAEYWLQRVPRPVYITWLGHASVRIAYADMVIYVDPLDLTTSPHDATLILVTHSHSDHYSPTDRDKVAGPTTQIIAPAGVATDYARRQSIAPGQTLALPGVRITGVASYNNPPKTNHPKNNNWVGFITELGGRRIYCAGDTDLTPEMKALTDIDVAFLPAGGTYTMNATEAADATKYFLPTLAIPYHWGRSVGTLADAQLFARNAACNAKVMAKGEKISTNDLHKDFSLAAHWQLDEVAGGIAHDSNGSSHATLYGDPVWRPVDGNIAGALELDGVDDYVATPFVVNPGAGAFSVYAWVKGGAAGQVVLSQQRGANWLMADASDGALSTELKGGGRTSKPLKSTVVITDGQWHRVGLVFDGTSRILYVDDVQAAKDPQSGFPAATDGLVIGADGMASPGTLWYGLIDDVRIYNLAVKP